MLVLTPDYTLMVGEVETHFVFNTRALRRLCEAKGWELEDLYLKVQKAVTPATEQDEALALVKDFTPSDMTDLLFYGRESWCAYHNQPFKASDLDKDAWLDCMGGLLEQRQAFAFIVLALVGRMMSGGDEKKRKVLNGQLVSASPGTASEPLP